MCIQTVTSHHPSQFQGVTIWMCRPKHTKKFLQTNPKSENRESPLSSILTDLQCLFSNPECHQKIAANPLKFTKETMNCLISMKKLSPCLMSCVRRHSNRQGWRYLKRLKSLSSRARGKSTKRLSMPRSSWHSASKPLNRDMPKKLTEGLFKTKPGSRRKSQLMKR